MIDWLRQKYITLTLVLENNKADLKYIFLILLTALVFFGKVLLYPNQLITGPSVLDSDTVNFFYPLYNYAYTALRNGYFPSWNSLILSGYPLAANPQFAMFYPLNVLFLFLPVVTAFGFSYLLHVFLGGTFMYILSKHLGLDRVCAFLAALVFMFGAFIVSHIYAGHYTMICATIWLPLLFLSFDLAITRKSFKFGLLTGVVLGTQLLAGHIQITYLSLIALFFYLIYKLIFIVRDKDYKNILRPMAILAVALLAGVLIAAVQLLPNYEYSTYSTRVAGLNYEDATSYSLEPGLLSFMFSNYLTASPWGNGEMPFQGFWEYSSYIGILTLILILIAICFSYRNRNVSFFILLAVISILLALGKYMPSYWLLYKIAPGFSLFRVPARFILLFNFAAAVLAGFGFAFLRNKINKEQTKAISRILIELVVLAILVTIVATFTTDKLSSRWVAMIALAILLIGSVIVIYLRIKNRLSGRYFSIVTTLFVLLNLWFFNMSYINVQPTSAVYETLGYVSYLEEHTNGFRVYDPESIMPHNHFMTKEISIITGYDAAVLNYYSEFIGENAGVIGSEGHFLPATNTVSILGIKLDLLNVKYVLSSKPITRLGFTLVYSDTDSEVYIYEYLNALPKAYIVHNAEVISSETDILDRLKDKDFDVRGSVILEETPANVSLLNEGSLDEATIEQYSAQEIVVDTDSPTPGFLVLSETWYPCWKVYIDGEPAEVYKADYTLMSVYVGAGKHTVQFVYEDQAFKIGILVSCATVLILVVIFSLYDIQLRRRQTPKQC